MRKVLIVDDEAMIREGLRYVIDWQSYGFEIVDTAENGEVGLEKIAHYQPDVVIADIKMPGKNGLEMINAAIEQGLTFYAVILSGYSDFDYARQAIQLGAVNYLLKPVNEDELIKILKLITQKETEKFEHNQANIWHAKLFGSDMTGVDRFRYVKLLRLPQEQETEKLVNALLREVSEAVVLTYRQYHYVVILSDEQVSEETIGQLCQHEMPQEEMLVSRWYAAGENLKPMVEELQSLSELIFLLPQQLLSQVIIENLRSHYPAIQQASERLLKAIFSRQGLKIALKDYWQNF